MESSDERVSMDAERLGQQLRTAREARELTLEQVEQALRIRAKFLGAFEAGAYEDLPGAVQARGFLRNYVRFLNLDEESILTQFDAIQVDLAARQPRARTCIGNPYSLKHPDFMQSAETVKNMPYNQLIIIMEGHKIQFLIPDLQLSDVAVKHFFLPLRDFDLKGLKTA